MFQKYKSGTAFVKTSVSSSSKMINVVGAAEVV